MKRRVTDKKFLQSLSVANGVFELIWITLKRKETPETPVRSLWQRQRILSVELLEIDSSLCPQALRGLTAIGRDVRFGCWHGKCLQTHKPHNTQIGRLVCRRMCLCGCNCHHYRFNRIFKDQCVRYPARTTKHERVCFPDF